ncbi:MAG: sigma-70 family RNA polymerase sigma factor [Bdellovibrio sp.]|nr:MAG: sigma-70 family RNA polymerase sigma factor [Bdellovibrio sp.]
MAPTKKKKTKKITKKQSSGLPLPISVNSKASKALVPSDPTTRYLAEIQKYPVLSKEEERELAIRYYETKDPKAAQKLVTSNLRFVVKIAAEYTKFGAHLIDLIQEGNMGLMQAIKEFNPYKGVRLITYAVWWIRGNIQEYLMRQFSLVRIGTTQEQRKLFYQLQKQKKELEKMGHVPTTALLSGRLGVSESSVQQMTQRLSGKDISLNQPANGDEGSTQLIDLQSKADNSDLDEKIELKEELHLLKDSLEELRPHLSPRELQILDKRLLADPPMTLREIAQQYGITREAVRQMETRVIKKIKNSLKEKRLV